MPLLVAIMGPTASGKTALAEQVATDLDAQLINADAFQIYRGLDVGTAKPADRERYHLLDLRDPDEAFGVGEYVSLAQVLLQRLYAKGRSAVVVGGTGLYVRALFEEYETMGAAPPFELREELDRKPLEELVPRLQSLAPEVAAKTDLKNPVRVRRALEGILASSPSIRWNLPPYHKMKFAVLPDPEVTHERIAYRTGRMMQNGWIEEVASLRKKGYGPGDPGFRAIGYRTLCRFLDGEVELDEAMATTIAETRRYAKKQRTWLRSEPNLRILELDDALEDLRRQMNDELG